MKTLLLVVLIMACAGGSSTETIGKTLLPTMESSSSLRDSLLLEFSSHPAYYATGFDFPVGKPDAKGYYNAQAFQVNDHLGDDWNGRGGGNSDLGDTVYAVANGLVTQSIQFYGGWGKVIRVSSAWKSGDEMHLVETLFAHLHEMFVKKGEWVKKGQPIGTIGNAEGKYFAHLHLEIREDPSQELGAGYSRDTTGYLNPTKFIRGHRKM